MTTPPATLGDTAEGRGDEERRVGELVFGGVVAKTIYAVTKLGVPDALADRPLRLEELARRVRADPDALRRVLRALADEELFVEPEPDVFAMTAGGRLLQQNRSVYFDSLMFAEHVEPAFNGIVETLRSGDAAAPRVLGAAYFDWVAADPDRARIFNGAMSDGARARLPLLLELDVWCRARSVVDVGGGDGTALAALLRRHAHLDGVVFDLPHARAAAETLLVQSGLANRASFAAGDFFDAVPAERDAYILLQILHDWSDEDAVRILGTIRAAIPDDGVLVTIEWVVPETTGPHPSRWLDVIMLVLLGGRERTEAEWRELFSEGGFEIATVIEGARASAIVARPRT